MDNLDWWRDFNRRFDPFRLLDPKETDQLYAERDRAPAAKIEDEISLAPEPQSVRLLLAGARGSGKSTELARAFRLLSRDVGPVVPIYVDIPQALPEDATTLTWLPLIAAAVRRTAQDWGAPPPPDDPLLPALRAVNISQEAFARMMDVVATVGVWMGPEGQSAAQMASLVGPLAHQAAELSRIARSSLAKVRAERDDTETEALLDGLRAELERIQGAAGRPATLLLDGLDKRPDMESVLKALQDADLLLDLPAAIVLSGPAQALFHPRFASLTMPGRFQPVPHFNLPVVHPDGSPKDDGIRVLLEIFESRAQEHDPARTRELLPRDQVAEAARLSSGVVREFLELLRQAAHEARRAHARTVQPAHLEAAARNRRHSYEAALDVDQWRELVTVLETRQRPRADVDELLFTNVVACYQNDHLWFRPNELLVSYVQSLRDPQDR